MPHSLRRWMRHGGRFQWKDPLLTYRNDPEYQRQRKEAKLKGEAEAVERRWAARWRQKLAMQEAMEKANGERPTHLAL